MAEQMPMAEGVSEGGGQEAGGSGEFQKLVGNVMKGMALIGEGLQGAGAPPEVLQGLQGVMQQFEQVISGLGGGGGGEQEPAPQKSRAVPLQESQGKPVGPAGV